MMQPASWTIFASAIAIAWERRTQHVGESSFSEAYLPPPPKSLGPSRRNFQEAVCGDGHRCIAWICRLNGLLGGALEKP
jgi:hypothetical protein